MFGCRIPRCFVCRAGVRDKGRGCWTISPSEHGSMVYQRPRYWWQQFRLAFIHVQWCYHGEWRSLCGSNVTWTNSWSRVWNHETTTFSRFEWREWGDTPIINTNMEHPFVATLLGYRVCRAVVYLSSHFKRFVEQKLFADWTLHKTWRIECLVKHVFPFI